MNEIYGNTMADLRRVGGSGTIVGVFAGIVLGAGYYQEGRLAHEWPAAVIGALVIGSLLPLAILPTCFFSIRLDGQHITHLFCGRIILRQRPVSQLESVRVGLGVFAVVFRFADGSRIRFLGARIRIIEALCGSIHQLLPNFRGFTFGRRYAFLSRIIHKFNPQP